MYLLDTNVLSELRKRRGDSGVKQWVAKQSVADLAISVVTVIEIETGIRRKERTDPDQAQILTRWFEQNVLTGFADRILPLDLAAARRVAARTRPSAPARRADRGHRACSWPHRRHPEHPRLRTRGRRVPQPLVRHLISGSCGVSRSARKRATMGS